MTTTANFVITFYTGRVSTAGTHNAIHFILYSDDGEASEDIAVNTSIFSRNFQRFQTDSFRLPSNRFTHIHRSAKIERVDLWKDPTFGPISNDWFLEKFVVENCATNLYFVFPVLRWIKSGYVYSFKHLDTCLPQLDDFPRQRKLELMQKKEKYKFNQRYCGGPSQVLKKPPDEDFDPDFWSNLKLCSLKAKFMKFLYMLKPNKWANVDDMNKIYKENTYFDKPRYMDLWNSDAAFGRFRTANMNPCVIALVKVIPEKFPVTDKLVRPLLEGLTLQDAIDQKRLFIIDLYIVDKVHVRKGYVALAPIALFFLDKKQQLMPVAIQLNQQPGPGNPIFTPLDDPWTWTYVKLWYNSTEADYHQGIAHLGGTHLLMEGFVVATHRNISPSHPVFKILAPHFYQLIAVNWTGLDVLLSDNGVMNNATNIGADGMKTIVNRGLDKWRLDVDGLLPEELKARGLDDPAILPGYVFRDDALQLYHAINKYARTYVDLYYTSADLLENDEEIQAWARELVKEKNGVHGGGGYKGIPGNGYIATNEDLVKIITCLIYTCSVKHASVNFPQYDVYGFPLNYPTHLKGRPPTSKTIEMTERDIMASACTRAENYESMLITKLLSNKGTNSLGDFEIQYIYDPKALSVVEEFRKDLQEISKKIKERCATGEQPPYDYLDPENIPNSISI